MNIFQIATAINEESKSYRIGNLQDYRKKLKNLDRKPTNDIFSEKSISSDGWAFHTGGLNELQFNIGFEEDNRFRFGLAFSLQPNRNVPDVSILYPRIRKFNYLFRDNPSLFKQYKLWNYKNSERSETFELTEIPSDWIQPHYFIFFGMEVSVNKINISEILKTFDSMLEIYLEIESDIDDYQIKIASNHNNDFKFSSNKQGLTLNRKYSTVERETNIEIRHSLIQEKLISELESKYGSENVGSENYANGGKVDVVVKINDKIIFYEIKTGNNARSCIRQALGQLLDYTFWPGKEHAQEMIVVGEPVLDSKAKLYLTFLSNKLSFPISYISISID